MKIRMKTTMAGVNFVHKIGEVIDVKPKLAKHWIACGVAETYQPEKPKKKPKIERAKATPQVETPEQPDIDLEQGSNQDEKRA